MPPAPFVLFVLMLAGIAVFHRRALAIALTGLALVTAHAALFTSRDVVAHALHEAPLLLNLLALLVGFELLSRHFEESRLPDRLPAWLPDDWKGGLALLFAVWVLSAFLDNIAAALVGGAAARTLYGGRVHIAFLVAIVACANAGGAGSVLGDTTTTMMWIAGKSPVAVASAFVGSAVAFAGIAVVAARRQQRHRAIQKDPVGVIVVDGARLAIVAGMLVGAVATNVLWEMPSVGAWIALVAAAPVRRPAWGDVPKGLRGAVFLCSLVAAASLMPVDHLPPASWPSTLALGFVSAFFDNIPLTKLALDQGGYDWGLLAYAVGFGGSMMWFGSSAGVALTTLFPEARATGKWIAGGWMVPIAYVAGFFAMLTVFGWSPG